MADNLSRADRDRFVGPETPFAATGAAATGSLIYAYFGAPGVILMIVMCAISR
ncbi:hypothetical protein GCM10009624_30780 [Gordonia sinesedis]